MGVASIILGILSFLCMFGGFLLAIVPGLGTVLSFGAPLLGIAGIVTGGIGLSRAKREGQPTGAPMAGLIISVIAFIPAVLVALTCGLCNACMTAGSLNPNSGFQIYTDGGMGAPHDPFSVPDAGIASPNVPPDPNAAPDPSVAPDPTQGADPADPNAPPPAFPPPPMEPPDPGSVEEAPVEAPSPSPSP